MTLNQDDFTFYLKYINIVSCDSHPTERLSAFVDYHLQPLVHKLSSFVKDTNDFLNKLLTIGNLPANSLLVTLGVSSSYTNIPRNEGINACERVQRTYSHKTIPTSTLCDLIRMILTMNNFSFNEGRTGVFSWFVISSFYFSWNVNLGSYSSWLVTRRFCVTREEPELLIDIRDLTTQFYVILGASSPNC